MSNPQDDVIFKQIADDLQTTEYRLQLLLQDPDTGPEIKYLLRRAIEKTRDVLEAARVALRVPGDAHSHTAKERPPQAVAHAGPEAAPLIINETFDAFCVRLRAEAREFSSRTGIRFHLLRAQPAFTTARLSGHAYEFQAVISGGSPSDHARAIPVGFFPAQARPLYHPQLCLMFDSFKTHEASFSGDPLARGRLIHQFGLMDANPDARVLHLESDFPFLGLVQRLPSNDPGLGHARSITRSVLNQTVDAILRRPEGDGAYVAFSWRNQVHRLRECIPMVRLSEAIEMRMGLARGPSQMEGRIQKLIVNIQAAGSHDRHEMLAQEMSGIADSLRKVTEAPVHTPAPEAAPVLGLY